MVVVERREERRDIWVSTVKASRAGHKDGIYETRMQLVKKDTVNCNAIQPSITALHLGPYSCKP